MMTTSPLMEVRVMPVSVIRIYIQRNLHV